MSRIRTYTTYTEVTNGLFIDIPDEEVYRLSESRNRRTQDQRRHLYIDPSVEIREEEVRRASNEGIWHQLRNMSERETIQYLDRISQEQENEQHNSTI